MKPLQVFGLIVVIIVVIVSACVINLRPVLFTCDDVEVVGDPLGGISRAEIQSMFLGSTFKADIYESRVNLFFKRQNAYYFGNGLVLNKVNDNKYRAGEFFNVSNDGEGTLEFTTDHGVIVSAELIFTAPDRRSRFELTMKRKSAVASVYHFMFEHVILAFIIIGLIGFALFEDF